MTIYISGPMEGVENYEENFRRAENYLENQGYEVVNPANIDVTGMSREEILKKRHLPPVGMRRNLYAQRMAAVARCEPGIRVCLGVRHANYA